MPNCFHLIDVCASLEAKQSTALSISGLFVYIVAETCPPIPIVDNAQPSTLHTDHGTLVEYVCAEGYHLLVGNQSTSVQHSECLQTGAWSTKPQDCHSESNKSGNVDLEGWLGVTSL